MTNKTTQWREENLEELSALIHGLYCEQYLKNHGEPYWTGGDYSKLEEKVKDHDRNIARFIIKVLSSTLELLEKEVERKEVEVQYDNPILEAQCTAYNQALSDVLAIIRQHKEG